MNAESKKIFRVFMWVSLGLLFLAVILLIITPVLRLNFKF